MLSEIAAKMTNRYVERGVINAEEKNIYAYGFEVALVNIVGILSIITVSLLLGNFRYAVVFLLFFSPNRIYSGGYHCKNFLNCLLSSIATFSSVLLLFHITPESFYRRMSLIFLPLFIVPIFALAPVYSQNHKLSRQKQNRAKIKSRRMCVCFSVIVLAWVLLDVGRYDIVYFGSISLCAVTFLLLLGYILFHRDMRETSL